MSVRIVWTCCRCGREHEIPFTGHMVGDLRVPPAGWRAVDLRWTLDGRGPGRRLTRGRYACAGCVTAVDLAVGVMVKRAA